MRIDILTLFPEIALAPLRESIIKRAQKAGIVEIHAHDLRAWALDKHRKTDDYLCGGGQGMLLKPEPVFAAVEELRKEALSKNISQKSKDKFLDFLAIESNQMPDNNYEMKIIFAGDSIIRIISESNSNSTAIKLIEDVKKILGKS